MCFACMCVHARNAHCVQKRVSELLVPDGCEPLWKCRDDIIVSQSPKVRTLLGVYTIAFWSVHLRTPNKPSCLLLEVLNAQLQNVIAYAGPGFSPFHTQARDCRSPGAHGYS